MKSKLFLLSLIGLLIIQNNIMKSQNEIPVNNPDKLVVVWTSGDPYVAETVALMYTHAAKTAGWFKEVTLIIWGPSAKLAAENQKIQEKLKAMQKDGIIIETCVVCANIYGVAADLKNLGCNVKGMGEPLTDYLKSGAKVLTF